MYPLTTSIITTETASQTDKTSFIDPCLLPKKEKDKTATKLTLYEPPKNYWHEETGLLLLKIWRLLREVQMSLQVYKSNVAGEEVCKPWVWNPGETSVDP